MHTGDKPPLPVPDSPGICSQNLTGNLLEGEGGIAELQPKPYKEGQQQWLNSGLTTSLALRGQSRKDIRPANIV